MRNIKWLVATGLVAAATSGCVETTTANGNYPPPVASNGPYYTNQANPQPGVQTYRDGNGNLVYRDGNGNVVRADARSGNTYTPAPNGYYRDANGNLVANNGYQRDINGSAAAPNGYYRDANGNIVPNGR